MKIVHKNDAGRLKPAKAKTLKLQDDPEYLEKLKVEFIVAHNKRIKNQKLKK